MKIKSYSRALLLCFLIAAGIFGCDTDHKKEDKTAPVLLLGAGCISTSPITMKSTTYDLDDRIIGVSEQEMANMSAQDSQPDMTSLYELYAGVELEIDWDNLANILTDPMSVVKENPLLAQFWALKKMATSTDAGADGTWMNSDDTIDPLLGYFETTRMDDRYRQILYSDFGVTPSGRVDYIVEDNKKVKTYHYGPGVDAKFGTSDDVLTKTVVYRYNSAGRMAKAVNYSDDEKTFVSSYVFSYDEKGRLSSLNAYSDINETQKLVWGSYSTCTWDDTGKTPVLDISLGLRIPALIGTQKMSLIKFHYEFNEDGSIHKMIQYQPMSSTAVETCSVYVYSKDSMLAMGGMNDGSDNFSDDGVTLVSRTVNELMFGEK